METLTEPDAPADPAPLRSPLLEGYDQDTVADFLGAVEDEKVRLRAEIDDARERERRALALLHMHENILVTMREAYAEVTETRLAAEARATAIIEEAARSVGRADHRRSDHRRSDHRRSDHRRADHGDAQP